MGLMFVPRQQPDYAIDQPEEGSFCTAVNMHPARRPYLPYRMNIRMHHIDFAMNGSEGEGLS